MVGTSNTNVLYESAGGAQEFAGAFVTTNAFLFLGVKSLLDRWHDLLSLENSVEIALAVEDTQDDHLPARCDRR
jgi:hypothetical protein